MVADKRPAGDDSGRTDKRVALGWEGERLAEQSKKALRSAMVEAAPEEASSRETDVKTAVRDRLDTEDSES